LNEFPGKKCQCTFIATNLRLYIPGIQTSDRIQMGVNQSSCSYEKIELTLHDPIHGSHKKDNYPDICWGHQRGTRKETVKLDEIEAVCNVTAKT
jgi:hypothetical protein